MKLHLPEGQVDGAWPGMAGVTGSLQLPFFFRLSAEFRSEVISRCRIPPHLPLRGAKRRPHSSLLLCSGWFISRDNCAKPKRGVGGRRDHPGDVRARALSGDKRNMSQGEPRMVERAHTIHDVGQAAGNCPATFQGASSSEG